VFDPDDLGVREKAGDQFGGKSRTATKIGHAPWRKRRNATQKILGRPGPFIFEYIAKWRRRHPIFLCRVSVGICRQRLKGSGKALCLVEACPSTSSADIRLSRRLRQPRKLLKAANRFAIAGLSILAKISSNWRWSLSADSLPYWTKSPTRSSG
jgi:hypothetical protein